MNVAIALGWPIIFAQSPQPTEVGLEWPTWIKWLLWLALGFFGLFPGIVAYMVWAERKVAARFQDRIGPNRVGPLGLLQPIADALKLLTKESIVPRTADQWVHLLAPVVILTSAFLVLAVIPFGVNLAPVNIPSGLLYLVAVSGLSPLGIFLAGWSSRNKYALLGAMRAVAQLVSYEIPQVLSTVPIVLWSGSLSLVTIFNKQLDYGWFLFSPPGALAFVILLIASLAEVNRTPFDLPEAESEIIAGFHTEFSSMRFGLFFLAEYLSVFGVSCLATALFLGGGTPIPFSDFPINLLGTTTTSIVLVNAILVPTFFLKVGLMVFVMFWVRATLPRMRVDRLMNFAWKYMVPMSLVNILAAAVWYECYIRSSRPFVLFGTPLRLGPLPLNWLISTLITLLILVPSFFGVQAVNRREFGEEVGTAPARRAAPGPVAAR